MRLIEIFNKICRYIFSYFSFGINILFNCRRYHSGTEGIVFSYDRPIQLYSLLESYYKFCVSPVKLHVIVRCSSEDYIKAYKELFLLFDDFDIHFHLESNFRNDLLKVLKNVKSRYLFYLVDDNLFVEKFDFQNITTFSKRYIVCLRMGMNVNYSYTCSQNISLPKFDYNGDFLTWEFHNEKLDWGYIFSVDGNIYETNLIYNMTKSINFSGPNSYEALMNMFRYIFYSYKGLCFHNSRLLNLNLNRVQSEIDNKCGSFSTSELLFKWNNGLRLECDNIYKNSYNSCHIEVDNLIFIKR